MHGIDMIAGHKTTFAMMAVGLAVVLAITFYLVRAGQRRINRRP